MLIFTPTHLELLQHRAQHQYPEECCGLLIGEILAGEPCQTRVEAVLPAENLWDGQVSAQYARPAEETKVRRYHIAPEFFLRSQHYARGNGWDIIGIYHSHPDHAAIPSEWDRRWAWPQYSYVIISVLEGVVNDVQSWTLDEKSEFRPQKLQSFDVSTPQRL
jgi:proteasome lid subunit RPN8/RPN11